VHECVELSGTYENPVVTVTAHEEFAVSGSGFTVTVDSPGPFCQGRIFDSSGNELAQIGYTAGVES
jgi:hypothetical protein